MQEKLPEHISILIGSTIIIVILVGVVIFAVLTTQKRKFRHGQQIAEIKYNFDKEILSAQLEIQTQTFESVSRELHDNVSNTISLALLNLNLAEKEKGQAYEDPRINEVKELLMEAKAAVKDYAWHINHTNLSQAGLGHSLQELAGKFKKLDTVTIEFVSEGQEFPIDPAIQIIIYRISQEALANAIRHSYASLVTITLSFEKPLLQIVINDNGKGYRQEQPEQATFQKKSSGINNMYSRAAMIEATLVMDSVPGRGTRVHLKYIAKEPAASHTP